MYSPQISIIIPLYNEQESFNNLTNRIDQLLKDVRLTIEVILVDDGSNDYTPKLIKEHCSKHPQYSGIILSRNFGHQSALTAGLANAKCSEAAFIIDGDLQDPPELLTDFYKYFLQGYDVIYGIRKKRKENVLKKMSYHFFYRFQKKMTDIDIPLDSGDFSLIGRPIIDILNQMKEESRYIRGLRSWIGYKQIGIEYERSKREEGETKYSIKKLFKLAYDGIFNFSEFPTKFIIRTGFISTLTGLVYMLYILVSRFIFQINTPQGFTTLVMAIIFFSGVQLISLGIISEYIMRIFFQVKKRPLYIIKENINNSSVKDE